MSEQRQAAVAQDRNEKRELLRRLLRERAAAAESEFPLSAGQQALWFLHQLAPDSAAYNVAFCGRVRSEIDMERFGRAVDGLVRRHPMLRTTFRTASRDPQQSVDERVPRCLEEVDAFGWSDAMLELRVVEAYRRPFDLRRGPVFRAAVFHRGDRDHVLLLVAHHIVFDAWSLGVVLRDLAMLYGESTGNVPLELSAIRSSYGDFVRKQGEILRSPEGEAHWAYWRDRLAGCPPVLDLPYDRPRPAVQTYRGATHHFHIDETTCAKCRHFARSEGVTPFMLLAAAYQVLLHQQTGQHDICIGTPLSGRSGAEFDNVVGYFVNPVVLRSTLQGSDTFRDHLRRVRESVIGAIRHGDYPFPELVKRLQPERDIGRTPLFQVMFNLVKAEQISIAGEMSRGGGAAKPLRLGDLEITEFPLAQQEGQFDLDLSVLDAGASMPTALKYNTDLFDASTTVRMAEDLTVLLAEVVAGPDQPLGALPRRGRCSVAKDDSADLARQAGAGREAANSVSVHGTADREEIEL